MTRFLGCILILLSGFLLRFIVLTVRRHERQALYEIVQALQFLEQEVRATLSPLPRLLDHQGFGPYADSFFHSVLSMHRKNPDLALAQCWSIAVASLPLRAKEKDRLLRLANRLNADEEDVLRALHEASGALQQALKEKEYQQKDQDKLITSICLSCSVLLLILLI